MTRTCSTIGVWPAVEKVGRGPFKGDSGDVANAVGPGSAACAMSKEPVITTLPDAFWLSKKHPN